MILIPQEAINAGNAALADYNIVCYTPGAPEYVNSKDKAEEGDVAEQVIRAALPLIETAIRAQVAKEIAGHANMPEPVHFNPHFAHCCSCGQ